jgi:hypothetical protein
MAVDTTLWRTSDPVGAAVDPVGAAVDPVGAAVDPVGAVVTDWQLDTASRVHNTAAAARTLTAGRVAVGWFMAGPLSGAT